ncbi:MAG TPA: ion channel [Chitinophagaceae bacterium]|nr:ion channel [Chitinophagaceae bacterium]HRG91498.1 ion channel [Chitinophagaceae bacterium]
MKRTKLKQEENTGFSNNSTSTGGRFINRDGKPNVIKRGVGLLDRYSWYHTLLEMKRSKFLLILLSIYIGVNLVFAGIYYLIGIDHLAGINSGSALKNFSEVFFFSAQTFTTVGYGRISPVGFAASTVSTFEAFLGLLGFAIATGLFYGRFSRPQAFLRFSDKALIAPFRNGTALMFRLVSYKNNALSEVEVKVTMAITTEENGKLTDQFFNLPLQLAKIDGLALSWTLVHPITEDSPFIGMSAEDIRNTDIEIMVFVKAFDTIFSNTVVSRTSYISSEIVWGAKFRMMYEPTPDKKKTVLHINQLNEIDKVEIPAVIEAMAIG